MAHVRHLLLIVAILFSSVHGGAEGFNEWVSRQKDGVARRGEGMAARSAGASWYEPESGESSEGWIHEEGAGGPSPLSSPATQALSTSCESSSTVVSLTTPTSMPPYPTTVPLQNSSTIYMPSSPLSTSYRPSNSSGHHHPIPSTIPPPEPPISSHTPGEPYTWTSTVVITSPCPVNNITTSWRTVTSTITFTQPWGPPSTGHPWSPPKHTEAPPKDWDTLPPSTPTPQPPPKPTPSPSLPTSEGPTIPPFYPSSLQPHPPTTPYSRPQPTPWYPQPNTTSNFVGTGPTPPLRDYPTAPIPTGGSGGGAWTSSYSPTAYQHTWSHEDEEGGRGWGGHHPHSGHGGGYPSEDEDYDYPPSHHAGGSPEGEDDYHGSTLSYHTEGTLGKGKEEEEDWNRSGHQEDSDGKPSKPTSTSPAYESAGMAIGLDGGYRLTRLTVVVVAWFLVGAVIGV